MIRILVHTILRLLFRVTVRGEMERHEKLLVVSNHQSFLDGVLLGAFLPIMPVWFVHSTMVRHWYIRLPLRLYPHRVVDTSNPWAMKAAIGLIESGWPVLIFPEGRVTVTGSLMKVYEGPAFVAERTGATVVPVQIEGAVYGRWSRMRGDFPRQFLPRITITIHPPRRIVTPGVRTAKLRRRLAAEALRRIMQEAAFANAPQTALFPAFLDAIALHGRRRRMLEDVRQEENSYSRLLRASLALGRIVARFSQEGEAVGLLMPNVSATVSLIFGMLAFRRVPAILNYTSGFDGIQNACRIANLRTVITSRAFLERTRFAETIERLDNVRLLYLEDLRVAFHLPDKLWLLGWALRFPRLVARPARPEDPAVVLFTSGSEGKPKGVVLSHRSILANVAQMKAIIDFSSKDKFLSALPLFHAFGLTVGVFLPLLNGCRVFLYPTPLHYRMIPETIYDRDCTVLFATGTFLGNYARLAHPYDFRSLRLVVAGAEKLSEETRKTYMDKFGIRVLEGYGATECAPVLSCNTPMAYRCGTVGELLPGIESCIEPMPGIPEGGLLHVRGPNLMLGYLRDERPGVLEPPRSIFGDGWYNTGDVVSVDEAGFLTILGRMRRFAKVAGEMVSLELAEMIATAASPNYEHASLAVTEPGRGETIVLFTQDRSLRRDELLGAARRLGAPEIAVPRRIVFLDGLPLLGNGKRDYVTLSRMAQELAQVAAR